MIEELKFLESEGITVKTPTGEKRIFFATVALKGDNLGVNGMCGFVECFVANFPCRMCKATKKQTETMLVEDPKLARTEESYESDVLANSARDTGIKEDFVFKEVKSLYLSLIHI